MHTSDFRRFLRIYAVSCIVTFCSWWLYAFIAFKLVERCLALGERCFEQILLGLPYMSVVSAVAALVPAYLIFIASKAVKNARSKKDK